MVVLAKLDRARVAGGRRLVFAAAAVIPDRTDCVNHVTRRQPVSEVILAPPVSQPPSERHSSRSSGPAARWIAPSTPPPPSSVVFAALTMASTRNVVMSARMTSSRAGPRVRHPKFAEVGAHEAKLRRGWRPSRPCLRRAVAIHRPGTFRGRCRSHRRIRL